MKLSKNQITLLAEAPTEWARCWQDQRTVQALAARGLVTVEFRQPWSATATKGNYRLHWKITREGWDRRNIEYGVTTATWVAA